MAYDKETIAGNIRALRAKAGLSIAELAELAGVNESTLGSYEKGYAALKLKTAWELADCFGMSIDELVGREWPMKAS